MELESEPEELRVVIAHREDDTREQLKRVVAELGYSVIDGCCTVVDLLQACRHAQPDLVFSGVELHDGNAIEALIEFSDETPTPAIIVTPSTALQDVEDALRDHVMAFLVEPISDEQIRPTIYLVCERFRQFECLKSENEDLKNALAARKVIEKAKGLLMGQCDLTEAQAFRELQKRAQSARIRLVELAQRVVEDANAENG
ncbi:MAG: ANTAR domain-containing protein [Planctomycetales bacterium]|nr:ANTAR domain-containing protein [Planctomycetales bacterium]